MNISRKIFDGYSNRYDLEKNFYNDLTIDLKNYKDKLDHLNTIKDICCC